MKYERITYPDKSFYHKITDFENPIVKHKINSYDDLFAIRQIKDILDYNKIKNTVLEIPCLLDAQADMRFNTNESANLKIVCNFINDLKFDTVRVFHPHNQEVVQNLIDNVEIINNKDLVETTIKYLGDDKIMLFSVDAGGYKPLMKIANQMEYQGDIYGASKSRKYVNGKSEIEILVEKQDFEGKDLLIVDDILIGGGTLIKLAEILKTRNVGKLYAVLSHITITNPRKELETLYEKIFASNSKYNIESYNLNNLIIFNYFN